ncbi:MAG: hypothetical protein PHP54_03645 [Clostridia bacterium]|nr:hypothetical protein [Clostridia bacterium]
MRNISIDISNKSNMLDKLVTALDGNLPYMSHKEKQYYDNYADEIKQDYNNFLTSNKECVPSDKQDVIKDLVNEYEETCTCRNALLNDLYYKDGIRDGICLLLECFRSE